ncbi:protein-disulfide reductase DsbD [Campylobacter devanensis]|uniref:protein-disulfide reductase DsbD n=1 Tax=Campylobacter devanensis TaxID=3161138 RepID=UPI000A32B3C2|nr:protein-disulfide reductase DsbD [Campylobacter sp. P0098]
MKKLLYIFLFFGILCFGGVLDPKDAFKLNISGDNQSGIIAKFDIADGVYLYQDKIKIMLDNNDITRLLNIPKAIKYEGYDIYRNLEIFIPAGIVLGKNSFNLDIYYQGCSDSGFCYQPLKDGFGVEFDSSGSVISSRYLVDSTNKTNLATRNDEELVSLSKDIASGQNLSNQKTQNEQSQIAINLANNSIFWAISTFFIYGVLLSLTPCIFPMIPILSSLIVAKGAKSAKSGFIISLIYVLAMSVTYAIAGVLASSLGASVQGMLQTPVVLISFSIVFIVLALSMFGLFEIELPKSLQAYLNTKSSKFSGMGGVIFMGVASALIVGPCVAAPLAGALLYIANSGDIVIGGLSLFVMSLGMGLPLLAIGLGGGRVLPKPGEWMVKIKIIFGFIMLAMALWIISPVIGDEISLLGQGVLGVILAVIFGAFENASSIIQRAIKGVMLIIFAISMVIVIDFSVSKFGSNLKSSLLITHDKSNINFKYVTNLKELKEIIKSSQKPILIDFWASWCVNCKELESDVLTQSDVAKKLNEFILIKIDLSQSSPENEELMREYQIYGPPVLLIYNNGELKSQITGLISPNELLQRLNQI